MTLQQEAERFLARSPSPVSLPSPPMAPPLLAAETASSSQRVTMIWFHHIKSIEKRKEIVACGRAERVRGFCKPGFPGVIVLEGPTGASLAFVCAIRAMRWQAMEIRFDGPPPVGRAAEGKEGLPSPFVELEESGMGEAAALCAAADLLDEFKRAVLKLDPKLEPAHVLVGTPRAAGSRIEEGLEVPGERADILRECVVAIDHMNDRTGYMRILAKWATQLGLGGRLWYTVGRARQACDIVLVLHGTAEASKLFLQRLRAEHVDVNRAGKPCKERQATVLQPGEPLDGNRSALHGWAVAEYSQESDLHAQLLAEGLPEKLIASARNITTSRTSGAIVGRSRSKG